jgi:dynein heavy chain
MYQYSLSSFIVLYLQSINDSPKSTVLDERLAFLRDHFTYSLYSNICRSLFKKDKLLFSFLLCTGLAKAKNEVDMDEWNFLLTGGLSMDSKLPPNPAMEWLSEKAWTEINRLSGYSAFKGLATDVTVRFSWCASYLYNEALY